MADLSFIVCVVALDGEAAPDARPKDRAAATWTLRRDPGNSDITRELNAASHVVAIELGGPKGHDAPAQHIDRAPKMAKTQSGLAKIRTLAETFLSRAAERESRRAKDGRPLPRSRRQSATSRKRG